MTRTVLRLLLLGMSLTLGVASAQGEPQRVLTLLDVVDTTEDQEMRWPVAVAASVRNERRNMKRLLSFG